MPKTKKKKRKDHKPLSRVSYRRGKHSMTIQRNKKKEITGLTCEIHFKKGVITELLDRVEGNIFRIVARSCSASVPMADVLRRSREYPTKTLITLK